MKKNVIYGSNFASLFIILISLDVPDAFFRFLAVGELPWSSYSISPNGMLLFLSVILITFLLIQVPGIYRVILARKMRTFYTSLPKTRFRVLKSLGR